MTGRAALTALLAVAPLPTAIAATAAPSAAPATGFVQVAASLLLIVAVIIGLAWLAARLRLTPRAASPGLRVLADLPLGPKERVVLIKVGDAQALVGVGADGVRSLGLLERPVELPPADAGVGVFAERLKSLMGGGKAP